MASLLERMSLPATGPVRSRGSPNNRASTGPYARPARPPRGDVDAQWSHDLFEAPSLSARLSATPAAPRPDLNFSIAQKALRAATGAAPGLSIKGAAASGNVVEVSGLVTGTTPDDVAAIFKRCGDIASARPAPVAPADGVAIRVTFRTAAAATSAVAKFDGQPADGRTLSVRIVGTSTAGTALSGRLGGADGLGVVRQEGSVDVLMDLASDSGSKMRSDSLIAADPRAQVLVAPPGADPADYTQTPTGPRVGGHPRRGRGGARRGGKRGGGPRMEVD